MKTESAVIEQPKVLVVALEIEGTSDLIQNKFSQKAIEQMLRKHMGLPNEQEKKVPSECVERATVRNVKGDVVMPTTAFKKAMLTASANVKGLKKTQLRQALFVEGNAVVIKYKEMIPRMDMVRTSGIGRAPDVRFRPSFSGWSARLIIQFADNIPVQTVVDLLNRSGSVGVGEWRPEKDGTYGTYRVVRSISTDEEIKEIRAANAPQIPPLVIPSWAMDVELTSEILEKIAVGPDSDE